MIQNLRRYFSLLFIVPAAVLVTLILCIAFFWQNSQDKQKQTEALQNHILNLTHQLESQSNFSDQWLAKLETDNRMLIHIEDNQIPLFFSGVWTPHTDRDTLIKRAQEKALEEHIDTSVRPYSSTLLKSSIFTIQGDYHDSYQGAVIVLATSDGFRSLTLLVDRTKENDINIPQLLLFLCLEIISLLVLWFTGRYAAAKATAPLAEYHQKQTDFVAFASHELRSPLAVIQSCASVSRSMPEQSAKMNQIILEECTRAGKLIKNMLLLASADAGKLPAEMQSVELDTLLLRLFESYEPLCSTKNIRLKLTLPDELLPCINGNPQWIHQILSIFIDNAIAYGCPESTPSGRSAVIEIKAILSKRKLTAAVSDHGPGIPDEQKALIFNRFYRSDSARKEKEHFGLGLSIAQSLAKQMRLTVDVTDTENGGTTFQIHFPL